MNNISPFNHAICVLLVLDTETGVRLAQARVTLSHILMDTQINNFRL